MEDVQACLIDKRHFHLSWVRLFWLEEWHSPAQAAVCGFEGVTTDSIGGGDDGKYEAGKYNHRGTGNVTVQIDYVYANERYCVTPGVTEFAANPNLGAVTNIYAVGEC